jgi:hypothetical protein
MLLRCRSPKEVHMGKYTTPTVRWVDALGALPILPHPFHFEFVLGSADRYHKRMSVALELRLEVAHGASLCFKRWGRFVSPASEGGAPSAALFSSQEAYAYVKGKSVEDLYALACWELGVPFAGPPPEG